MSSTRSARQAGVVVPTFSLRSASDWGVGEIPDLAAMAAWLELAGQGALHTLPLVERPGGERSPYSALSAFAIDPIHVGVDLLEDFATIGGRAALADADRRAVERLRADPAIDYDGVRDVKARALELAFARFAGAELATGSARARRFAAFQEAESAWLGDYALYRTLRDAFGGRGWPGWPEDVRRRDPFAVREALARHAARATYHAYVQWVAHEQLDAAHRTALSCGVEIVGDLPFTVAGDSADAWAHPAWFDVAMSIGAPPDAFNADGQDWALPAFRWDEIHRGDFGWLRQRLGHAGRWLDGVRIDHVVGYFRTFVRPPGMRPHFEPSSEAAQRALGGAALDVVRTAVPSLRVVLEDLGDIPPFVREAMAERGLPGYRVVRWEADGPVFRDPRVFPPCSVATFGTHDTSSLAAWWTDELGDDGRRALAAVPAFARLQDTGAAFTPAVHDALVDGLYAAGSDVALLVVPDLFGETDRINTPATVGDHNWRYRLPWSLEVLAGTAGRDRAARLAALARAQGRAT
jgi:4-alpha-glucanotransferase